MIQTNGNKKYLRRTQKLFRIKIQFASFTHIFSFFIQYFQNPSLQILVTFTIRQIMYQYNTVHWIVEYTSSVFVT